MNKSLCILLIDDNPNYRLLIERELRQEFSNLRVAPITEAEGFAQALAAGNFDLVITDYRLRWSDGLKILRAVKERHPDRPVIMFTATGNQEIAVEAMKAGVDNYMIKSPKHLLLLPAAVRSAFERVEHREEIKKAEEALRASEKRFRALIENSLDAISLHEADGTLLYRSPSASRILGYKDEERLGRNVFELIHPDDREKALSVWSEILHNPEKIVTAPCRFRHQDGSWRWLEVTVHNLLADPSVQAIIGNYRDITDRKRAEEKLRESEAQFRRLAETTPSAIFIYQGEKNRYVNPACEVITGYTSEELLGMKFWDLIHPDFRELVRERGMKRQRGEAIPMRYEVKILTKKGEERWLDFTAAMIEFEGQPAVLGTAFDITERKRVEETLRQSEQKYRILVDHSPYCIHQIDMQGKLLSMNPAGLKMMGLKNEREVIGMPYPDTVADEDREKVNRLLQAALKGQSSEFDFKATTGRFFQSSFVPIKNTDGAVTKLMGLTLDITARKRAEEALRESEKRFRALIENASDAIKLLTAEGIIIYATPSTTRMLGYCLEEFVGRNTFELIHPDDRENTMNMFAGLLRAPGSVSSIEARVRHKDGSWRWVEGVAANLLDESSVQAIVINYRDVTERKRTEAAMRESERKLGEAQRIAHVGYWERDIDVDHITWSDETYRIFGLPPQERILNFAGLQELIYPEDRRIMVEAVAAALRGGPRYDVEYRVVRPTGEVRLVHSQGDVMWDDSGRPRRMFGMVQDITERKRAEERLRQAGEQLKTLSRRLLEVQETERRHIARELHDEIGQSLTAIKLTLQVARQQHDLAAVHSLCEESTRIAERTIQQVRNLSLDLHPSIVDDLGLVAALRWYLDRQAQLVGLSARLTADPSFERQSASLEIACFRIAQEAITNVIRHAHAKSVWVELRHEGDEIVLRIEDDGIGFEVEAARERARRGESLGLVGMQERALLMGGQLEIHSRMEKGTEIVARFPTADEPLNGRNLRGYHTD